MTVRAPLILVAPLLLAQAPDAGVGPGQDVRSEYDVQSYSLDLALDTERQALSGSVLVEARALVDGFQHLRLDLAAELRVRGVWGDGEALSFEHDGDRLDCILSAPVRDGATFAVTIEYAGEPRAVDGFTGFHWRRTRDGRPWIGTSCQLVGAHTWWPCKASFFHPEDKPERVSMSVTVPAELYAVSNGRLVEVAEDGPGRRRFTWRHD